MKTVWKFELGENMSVAMPYGAKIVKVERYVSGYTLWAEVDPTVPPVNARFCVYGTGHEIPDVSQHVFTWFEGAFVWHLYRRTNTK